MKRSGVILLGAAGVCLTGWGVERAINRPPRAAAPLPAECIRGPDGALPGLPQCQPVAARSSSNSSTYSSSSSRYSGSGSSWTWGSGTSSSPSSVSHGPAVSQGGFGSTGHGVSSGS